MGNAAGALISTSHDTAIWLRHLLTDNKLLADTQRQELISIGNQDVSGDKGQNN